MAFITYQQNRPGVAPVVHSLRGVASTTFHIGDAFVLSSGTLSKATGAVTPEYICVAEITTPNGGGEIPVVAVEKDATYETTRAVAVTASDIGTKYTIHTDGAQITATSTAGTVKVVASDGLTAGSRVLVKFA